jgi:hypothetical protein
MDIVENYFQAEQMQTPDFVVMDNGGRFYLHVIGITPLQNKRKAESKVQ